jgi:hypothetical protein
MLASQILDLPYLEKAGLLQEQKEEVARESISFTF